MLAAAIARSTLPWLAAALLALGAASPVRSDPYTSDDVPTAVEPPQLPTEVTVAAYLIGLSRISEPSSAFPTAEVELLLQLSWKDPRIAFTSDEDGVRIFQEEEAAEMLSEIWSPDLEIQNEVEQRKTESLELTLLADGTVRYEERLGAKLNAELDLRRFPFDDQVFEIEFQSFLWDKEQCSLTQDEGETGFDPDFETPEWVVTAADGVVADSSEIRDDRPFSTYTFHVRASRRAGHYVLRFMLPLVFVIALTWSAFWMPVDSRPRVGFLALLTVVASHTVITGDLPRLHYPTFADVLLFACYLFASALIVLSIWIQRLEGDGETDRAQRLEVRARWAPPVVALVFLVGSGLILWS